MGLSFTRLTDFVSKITAQTINELQQALENHDVAIANKADQSTVNGKASQTSVDAITPQDKQLVVGTSSGPTKLTAADGDVLQVRNGSFVFDHVYDPANTVNVVGDLHIGWTLQSRLDDAFADLAITTNMAAHRVYVGDLTQDSTSTQDTQALAWLAKVGPKSSWSAVAGNHDLIGRDITAWSSLYTQDGNWYKDIGATIRLIGISADNTTTNPDAPQTLSQTTLDYLEARLSETGRDCLIISHGPLMNTVVGGYYPSTTEFFSTQADAAVRTILAKYVNARAWISGHTHSPITLPTITKLEPLGNGRYIAAINVSAVAYQADTSAPSAPSDTLGQPNFSFFISCLPDRIDVRVRDHLTHGWMTLNGNLVTSIPRNPTANITTSGAQPLLLLMPGASRTTVGSITPSQTAGITTIAGVYGTAWKCDNGAVYYTLGADGTLIKGSAGTVLVRATLGAATGNRRTLLDIGDIDNASYGLMQLRYEPSPTSTLTYVHWHGGAQDASIGFTSPWGASHTELFTYMIRWNGATMEATLASSASKRQTTRTNVDTFNPARQFWVGANRSGSSNFSNAAIESVIVYDRPITDAELNQVASMNNPWTWTMLG